MRITLSWLCFWLGDLVSRLPDSLRLYPAYNRLMLWSDDLQRDDPRGPWSKLGENNTFVIADRNAGTRLARAKSSAVRKLHLLPSN